MSAPPLPLNGRRAIITGGGRGIGRGIVEAFLAHGAIVAVLQRSTPDDSLLANRQMHWVPANLADPNSIRPAVEKAAAVLSGLDVIVNNAGVMFERDVEAITPAEWDAMVSINLRAPLFVTQAALPHLRDSGRGSIVNIGSIEGIGANPLHAAYSATKAGLHGLTRALAVDLGATGIRCNAIAPGWIDTDLSAAYLDSMPDPARVRAELEDLHPVRHTGSADDIGNAAVFLASDLSSFITGETLIIDGGRTIQLPLPQRDSS